MMLRKIITREVAIETFVRGLLALTTAKKSGESLAVDEEFILNN